MTINIAPLQQLADLKLKTLAESMGVTTGLPVELQTAIDKLNVERSKEVTEAAAAEILNTIAAVDNFLAGLAQQVVELDNRKAGILALAENVKRAKDYGFASQNFLPALKVIGEPLPASISKDLTLVPKDWVKPEAAQAATEAAAAAAE